MKNFTAMYRHVLQVQLLERQYRMTDNVDCGINARCLNKPTESVYGVSSID